MSRRKTGPQLTIRDLLWLLFIAQQGAIRFDQLQILLARLSPSKDKCRHSGILTEERTRKVIMRFAHLDLFVYKQVFVGQKAWIWLTRRGLDCIDVPFRLYEPSPRQLPHIAAVNDIRLIVEARRSADVWKSERELWIDQGARIKGRKRGHLPDAELRNPQGSCIAIECEISQKNETHLEEIVFDLAATKSYTTIWYFVPPSVVTAVQHAIAKLPSQERNRFVIYDLRGEKY